MSEFDRIKYCKNFINQVICRIDFLEYINNEDIFDNTIIKNIIACYPQKEKDQLMKFNLININNINIGSQLKVDNQSTEGIQMTYTTRDGKNKVILSNKFIIVEINKYDTFEQLISSIENTLQAIFKRNKITVIRTGIRYINIFNADEIRIVKKFFPEVIANALSTVVVKDDDLIKMKRSMHLIEYLADDMFLNFRFGLYNRDYPNPIKKNDFVLDFDCYTEDAIDNSDEIVRYLIKGHDAIQYLFEGSITDNLREVMRYE